MARAGRQRRDPKAKVAYAQFLLQTDKERSLQRRHGHLTEAAGPTRAGEAMLGHLYAGAAGVPPVPSLAVKWYRRAAEAGLSRP